MKPQLLDLYCGAGGCARGYQNAGFYVVGVDVHPQPRYVGDEFIHGDALETVKRIGHLFDAIHASPPCQFASEATPVKHRGNHPNLIPATRSALLATGRTFVIENVENARAHLVNPIMLCGTMFGLRVWRHRYFEIHPPMWVLTPPCKHDRRPIVVKAGSHSRKTMEPVRVTGGARTGVRPRESVEVVRWAMEIDWMTQAELTQAVPPAYTEWIGRHLLEAIGVRP